MPNKQHKLANALSVLLMVILVIVLVGSTVLFVKGQLDANRAIVDAGKAVLAAASQDNAQTAVDYTGAISYLEAAQQAYSENSIVKVTSLIYTLATTVILGYGAKMLRLGSSDKQELCQEILGKTEEQFTMTVDQMLSQQRDLYTAMTACENAAYLSFLLQSNFSLAGQLREGPEKNGDGDTVQRLQVELTRSLQRFRDFLVYCRENGHQALLNKAQWDMLQQSWTWAKTSISEYCGIGQGQAAREHSPLYLAFGLYDYNAVTDLFDEIVRSVSQLNERFSSKRGAA